MTTIWRSGRESSVLDAIIDGTKTIEGRLARGKFAKYRPGDSVELRRDVRDKNGVLHDGDTPEVRVQIVAVREYSSFAEMLAHEGYERVIPMATSQQDAELIYAKYYSANEQRQFGVLAIEVRFVERVIRAHIKNSVK